ncbi:Protein of unknown function, DUF393 [Noviherbaspirillum humi]|uniref:Uncharacterized protein n=1 Tax=Noviherbaspirillum humi TaxID=1688639 RepID=A0A239CE76_9BURK|nr:DCC1-like thiol-disulfide oxidoreductase family protein [Noviherbaspirillum humi]SNS17941.1 Protein of unknown function, DUF393 [Noviherbaspirillum humi]
MVANTGVSIFFDGVCPFCHAYVRLLRLREVFAPVRLIDIRAMPELAEGLMQAGYDLEQGMLVLIGDAAYYGADAMHALALLSEPRRRLNCLHRLLRCACRVGLLHPMFRLGRRMALRLCRPRTS